jgi:hypothetical protein
MPDDATNQSDQPPTHSGTSGRPTRTEQPSLGREATQFVNHVDSLADTLPLTMLAVALSKSVATADFGKYTVAQQPITTDNYLSVMSAYKSYTKAVNAEQLITRSFFVSLISQYDAFLGAILRTLFILRPKVLDLSERQITYSDLLEFGSIEAARDHIIEKEVETILRKSHSEQFDMLEKRFDLPLRTGLDVWPNFIEITERRNLFVHASGRVSAQYINVCKDHGVVHEEPITRGKELYVDQHYFNKAHACIVELGVKLVHTLWRKQLPDDRKAADQNLNIICYDLIAEKRWLPARRLLDFAVGQKKHHSEEERRRFVINRAQAYKWSGDESTARKVILSEDWTASSDTFKLAVAVILDEYGNAASLMSAIGPAGRPNKHEYCDWPLFSVFRKTDAFLTKFAEVFNEQFQETPPTPTGQFHTTLRTLDVAAARLEFLPIAPKTQANVSAPDRALADSQGQEPVLEMETGSGTETRSQLD